ncbi:nucleoside hydrolase [Rhodocytophaga rosea]|uniref:Nucleoside hydrolase n=1 Tax=Rhodocytophaga rosea TaxID=2704465 RepID=A0A6C0GED1_9BACT|nr:nucleoside hydrolase [Rhodocytophaga rosea]QHT66308.1 nucleoside hydrolase [Rhodocytophaga rosea]
MSKLLIFDHDGAVDDLLSLMLLLTMDHIQLKAISITPADCYPENAIETTYKLLTLARKTDMQIGAGNYYGINAFPAEWRAKPKVLNALPSLINIDTSLQGQIKDSVDVLVHTIRSSDQPVTILLTGPCSNLVFAIEQDKSILQNIAEVIWMGGAVDVPGNVRTYNHDGSAEWNVFWDPVSSHKLLTYQLPLVLIPLDVTNMVPVSMGFLKILALQSDYPLSNLAGQFWATTIDTIPSYEYTYFMWDILAASYLGIPDAFVLEKVELEIQPNGHNSGQTFRKPGSGKWVQMATHVNKERFYQYVLQQLKR